MAGRRVVALDLVRHGATVHGEEGRFSGWARVPLSADGRRQAREVGRSLRGRRYDGVWSSDLPRAMETARLASLDAVIDPRLRELDFGELEGARWEDIPANLQAELVTFDGFRAPGGESVDELRERVRSFISDLAPGAHLLVTHGGVIRSLLRQAGRDETVPHGGLVRLENP
jgi:probable phosphoglycerate mutase